MTNQKSVNNLLSGWSTALVSGIVSVDFLAAPVSNRPFAQLWPGNEVRGIVGEIGCDVCVSHLSFRFSSALKCRSAITVVFLAVLIEAGLVLYSSLIVFRGQMSSGSAGYLPFVRLTDRTSASPTANGLMHRALPP